VQRKRLLRSRVPVLTIAAFATAVAIAQGSGGSSYPHVSKNVSNVDPARTAATVRCPASKPHVVSGGLRMERSNVELEVGSILPSASHKAWVGGGNNTTASPDQMTVTAICSKRHFVYRAASVRVPVDKAREKKVPCPPGSSVAGGGVGAPGDHGVEVGVSEPADGSDRNHKVGDAWVGSESNSSAVRVKMSVVAICAARGHYRYVRSAAKNVPDNQVKTVKAACPGSSSVTGGGLDLTGRTIDREAGDSYPIDDGDAGSAPDNGWSATANNDASGSSAKARAFAVCLD
jgi:hypothetical protein